MAEPYARAAPPEAEVLCSVCPRLGRPCPAARAVAATLGQAHAVARRLAPALEITGRARLDGCRQSCVALYRVSPAGVELFCGVAPTADIGRLSALVRGFLRAETAAWTDDGPRPLAFAMIESPPPAGDRSSQALRLPC